MRFYAKNGYFAFFEPPFGGLVVYDDHLRLSGCVPIGSSWIPPIPRSCGLPPVDVFTCCRNHLYEYAPMTKSCQLPLSATSVYTSTLMSRWGHMLPRPSVPALPHFVSYAASAALFPDLFSSHWCRRSSCLGWIRPTVMDCSSAFLCASLSDYSQWLILLPGWCFPRRGSTTSPRSSASCTSSKYPSERIDYKLALLVYKCLQGVAPLYLADDLCRTADVEVRHRLRSASSPSLWSCAVRGCRRTATELSRLPPRESGTVCHATSRHVCTVTACFLQSSEDSSLQLQFSLTILLCLRTCEVTLVITDTLIAVLTYLLTHWKARFLLLISVNWTFFAKCYGWGARSDYRFKISDFAPTGVGWPKISGRMGRPHQPFSSEN